MNPDWPSIELRCAELAYVLQQLADAIIRVMLEHPAARDQLYRWLVWAEVTGAALAAAADDAAVFGAEARALLPPPEDPAQLRLWPLEPAPVPAPTTPGTAR